jgi:hypothetical protein
MILLFAGNCLGDMPLFVNGVLVAYMIFLILIDDFIVENFVGNLDAKRVIKGKNIFFFF